jgi:predicted aconitase with swiveling domain
VHVAAVPESSLHVNVVPVLLELKLNVAPVAFVGFAGPEPIVITGAVVSIVHVLVALPVLPAGSVAVTVNVCEPAARPA